MVSLGHTGRRVVLGHTVNTLGHIITRNAHNVLRKFLMLGWAVFIAILGCMWPMGHGLDTPVNKSKQKKPPVQRFCSGAGSWCI